MRSSGMVSSEVLITVTGDRERLVWLITINGIRNDGAESLAGD
jgi:hypothetical protein